MSFGYLPIPATRRASKKDKARLEAMEWRSWSWLHPDRFPAMDRTHERAHVRGGAPNWFAWAEMT
jgi:hypothetical protein